MDAVTYPNPSTVELVKDWMVGLRVDVNSQRDLAMEFRIQYTPTLVVLDGDRTELHRSVGFHPPDQLVPELMAIAARAHYQNRRIRKALALSRKILSDHPKSTWAAEASKLEAACRTQTS